MGLPQTEEAEVTVNFAYPVVISRPVHEAVSLSSWSWQSWCEGQTATHMR